VKKITAVIKPLKLDDVKEALNRLGVGGMTVSEVRGGGKKESRVEFLGSGFGVGGFLPKICIELVVTDETVEEAIGAIRSAATTDTVGDGKIFVYDVETVIRIRTGDRDEEAI
jgi:nitrogen regulatory protein P-II 1